MNVLWFATFAVLFAGYFAFEGANVGLGVLLPVLGRDEPARARLVSALGPFVLAGEVWLVAVGGVLFGAFPQLEADTLHALYPLVVTLLVGWVVRDAGLWFRRRAAAGGWRRLCDGFITGGSLIIAAAWGLVFGALAGGLDDGSVTAVGVLLAPVVVALLALHGAVVAARRLGSPTAAALTRRLGAAARMPVTALVAALPALVTLVVAGAHTLDHAAPDETLRMLSLFALPVLPIIAAAQWWAWRIFGRPSAVESFF
jgi:cytochrome d ubiquinol oxidase subunit II